MINAFSQKKYFSVRRITSIIIIMVFIISLPVSSKAQVLPITGTSGTLTPGFQPPVILGLKIHPENPLLFDFIVDQGQSKLTRVELKSEIEKLVKYFFAALTIPDKEAWVNLSPYEKERIIPDVLGRTTMGKTMLEQDYALKQLAASLTNPETELGKEYWKKVGLGAAYSKMSDLNKVWIVPQKAEVLESNGIVVVGERKLKVMMDEEYQSQNLKNEGQSPIKRGQSLFFRSTILPIIEKEVNEGKSFSDVRQIYNSAILAAWYKKAFKESLLGNIYTDKSKVAGIETNDKEMKQKIYEQYLEAFKKGAYNLIKEEVDPVTGELIPRKYFSGGIPSMAPVRLTNRNVSSSVVQDAIAQASTAIIVTVVGEEPSAAKAQRDKLSSSVSASPVMIGDYRYMKLTSQALGRIKNISSDQYSTDAVIQDLALIIKSLIDKTFAHYFRFGDKNDDDIHYNFDFPDDTFSDVRMKLFNFLKLKEGSPAYSLNGKIFYDYTFAADSEDKRGQWLSHEERLLERLERVGILVHDTGSNISSKFEFSDENAFKKEFERRLNGVRNYFYEPVPYSPLRKDSPEEFAFVLRQHSKSMDPVINELRTQYEQYEQFAKQNLDKSYWYEVTGTTIQYNNLLVESFKTYSELLELAQRLADISFWETHRSNDIALPKWKRRTVLDGFYLAFSQAVLLETGLKKDPKQVALILKQARIDFSEGREVIIPLWIAEGIAEKSYEGYTPDLETLELAKMRLMGAVLRGQFPKGIVEKVDEIIAQQVNQSGDDQVASSTVNTDQGFVNLENQNDNVGGIDFDPTKMNLQIKRNGRGVPLPLPQQNLEQINIQGLFPVIINIVPVNTQTLPVFLGLAPREPGKEIELSMS